MQTTAAQTLLRAAAHHAVAGWRRPVHAGYGTYHFCSPFGAWQQGCHARVAQQQGTLGGLGFIARSNKGALLVIEEQPGRRLQESFSMMRA